MAILAIALVGGAAGFAQAYLIAAVGQKVVAQILRDLLIDAVVFFAARILVIVIAIGVMAWMDWRLTLMALAILPPLWLMTRYFGGRIKGAVRKQRRKEGKIAVVMTEDIFAINVVKGFAREA